MQFFIRLTCFLLLMCARVFAQNYQEPYRPQVHFSPKAHWMNDPNGTIYYKGVYHLFYQYYPGGSTWGPMHWGHATSKDGWHWREEKIALYPDSLGYIFSGCIVVDSLNTSGLGRPGLTPLVAIYTNHDVKGERAQRKDYETQRVAYSLDAGKTWEKLAGPPVVANPGIRDFRDPTVCWDAGSKRWILTLASFDRVSFYNSTDLLHWTHVSDFGSGLGAHGGVWECPDLFKTRFEGRAYWVLLSSINPGGVAGGSATQYFIGNFDGHRFVPVDTLTRWLDYGPDNYAGRLFGNAPGQPLFIGWMSNWLYAQEVPTDPWRSANTISRRLSIFRSDKGLLMLGSAPDKGLGALAAAPGLGKTAGPFQAPAVIQLRFKASVSGSVVFTNGADSTVIGYDAAVRAFYIDRSQAGRAEFSQHFAGRYTGPRFSRADTVTLQIVCDRGSFELFADGGRTVLTALVFPRSAYDRWTLRDGAAEGAFSVRKLASTWR